MLSKVTIFGRMSEGQSTRHNSCGQLESLEEAERSRMWWSALPTNVTDLLNSVKDSGQMVPTGPEPSVDPRTQIILSLLSSASPPQSKVNLKIRQRFLPVLETLEFSEAVLRPHVTRHGVDSFNTRYGPCSLIFSKQYFNDETIPPQMWRNWRTQQFPKTTKHRRGKDSLEIMGWA